MSKKTLLFKATRKNRAVQDEKPFTFDVKMLKNPEFYDMVMVMLTEKLDALYAVKDPEPKKVEIRAVKVQTENGWEEQWEPVPVQTVIEPVISTKGEVKLYHEDPCAFSRAPIRWVEWPRGTDAGEVCKHCGSVVKHHIVEAEETAAAVEPEKKTRKKRVAVEVEAPVEAPVEAYPVVDTMDEFEGADFPAGLVHVAEIDIPVTESF